MQSRVFQATTLLTAALCSTLSNVAIATKGVRSEHLIYLTIDFGSVIERASKQIDVIADVVISHAMQYCNILVVSALAMETADGVLVAEQDQD